MVVITKPTEYLLYSVISHLIKQSINQTVKKREGRVGQRGQKEILPKGGIDQMY